MNHASDIAWNKNDKTHSYTADCVKKQPNMDYYNVFTWK